MNWIEWVEVMLVLALFLMVRNNLVFSIRTSLLSEGDDLYDWLPSYEAMLYSPRHLMRWTLSGWRAWAEIQRAKEAA